jgi:hypothetical protein
MDTIQAIAILIMALSFISIFVSLYNSLKKRKSDLTTMNSLIGNFDYTEFYVALKDSYNWFVENHVNARK